MNSPTHRSARHKVAVLRGAEALLAVCAWMVWADSAEAAQLSVEFDVQPKIVRLGDMVTATFKISGASNPPAPRLPPLPDFRVSPRPAVGSQMVIRNGRMQSSQTFTYQLMPTREGTFQIGPIDYAVAGQRITLPAVEVQVASEQAAQAAQRRRLDEMLFARVELEKDTLFVQENGDVLLSVYFADLRLGRDFQLSGLPTSGLAFRTFRDLEGGQEMVNGRVYEVRRFRSTVRGLTAGTFTIAPTLTVQAYSSRGRRRSSSVFDSFFFRDLFTDTQDLPLKPEPVTLTVRSLPEQGRPETFSGAVGDFQFDVQAAPLTVRVGDPITLKMGVSGQGNLDAVSAPSLDLGSDFRVYDARLLSKQIDQQLTYGSKTFEQVVIPRTAGIEALPELRFSYFDPEAAEYRVLRKGPFQLTVTPNQDTETRVVQARSDHGGAPDGVDVLERDIAYLKDDPGAWRNGRQPWYRTGGFWAVQTLPPILSVVAWAVARRRDGLARDRARSRRVRAPKELAGRLQCVRAALEEGRHHDFYEALWQAVSGYFGDRLNLAPGAVTGDEVAAAFRTAGMPAEEVEQVRHLFELCEHSRFGLGPSKDAVMTAGDRRSADVIYEKLQNVIRQCENVRI